MRCHQIPTLPSRPHSLLCQPLHSLECIRPAISLSRSRSTGQRNHPTDQLRILPLWKSVAKRARLRLSADVWN